MLSPLSRRQLAAFSPLPGRAMARALMSGSGRGAESVERVVTMLRARYAADLALLTDSGTSALQLALRIAVAASGAARPVVALPAFTCFEVASAAVGAGVRVICYDLLPDRLAPDPDSLERALLAGARVVVVSPLFGVPVEWESIEAQLATHGAIAIEDAAQGHGSAWRDRPLGSLASLSVLSFGRGKGWTGGSGGALLLRGDVAASPLAREWSTQTRATSARSTRAIAAMAQWSFGRPSLYAVPSAIPALGLGRTVYHPPAPPRAMDGFAASLLLATERAAAEEAEVRRRTGALWRDSLAGLSHVRLIDVPAGATAGYLRFPIRISRGGARLTARDGARRLGIASSYPTPLDHLTAIRPRLVDSASACLGAETLARELVTLPTHSLLTARDISAIADVVAGCGVVRERSA
ncbi:MAG TPA: DegT/DnrJ/EryC1/StrS family aminotransferase [Gemmatimonadaceae bacterium]|nr:DegT/DnrJ/EryC1/StrS family aminotransferase [Gemmatimonadaceae bacterium]